MPEEVDEYGIPIKRKVQPVAVDEFGVPIKKKSGLGGYFLRSKQTSTPLSANQKNGGQVGTSVPQSDVDKGKVIDYLQGLKTPEQKTYSKPVLKKENAIVAFDKKNPYSEEKIDKEARAKIDETMYDEGEDWKDPLKGVYKKVAATTPIPTGKDLLIQDRATKIIENSLMPDGYEAVRILGDSHFGDADDKNLTANRIKAKADNYLKATKPFRDLVFENAMAEGGIVDDPMADYNAKEKFYDAAIKAYAEKNPNFKAQLQEAGGLSIEENGKRGQVIEQVLNDPDFITYINKENPKLAGLAQQVQSDLYKDNKDYGVNQVANKVSREIQKSGYNNIDPVFNFAGEGAKQMADITAKSVLTPEEYQIYQENNVFEKLDMPSLAEGFASAGKDFGKGILNTFTTPFESVPETIKKGWEKEASNVSADPKGLSKFFRDSGHAMGFVASIGATGNIAGGLGMGTEAANLTSLGVGFLGDNLEQARMKYPDSPVKQWTSALFNTGLYMAMGKSLFPAAKVEQALTKVQPEISKVVENLASGKITKEAARQEFNTIGKQALDMASVGLQKNLKVSAEMTGITILNKGLDKIMGMDDDTFAKYHPEGEEADTFKSMFLSNIIVNGLAARGQVKAKNNMAKESIYEAASNPQRYRRIIEGAEIKGDIKSAKDLLDNLDYVTNLKKDLDARGLTEKQKKDYLFNAIKSKALNASKPQSPDATLTRSHAERVKELEEVNQGILEGKDADEIITTSEQKKIDELQKTTDEGKQAAVEIESLTKNNELDNKEIDAKIKGLDKESTTYSVQKQKLEQQRKERNADYESSVKKLEKPALIAKALEAVDKDLPEFLREGAKADIEAALKEAAEQLNSSPSEAKTARSFYGDTFSDVAKKLFPDAKTKVPEGYEEKLAEIVEAPTQEGVGLKKIKIGEFEKDEMLSMIDNRKDTVEEDPESSFGIESEEGALDKLKQKIESGDHNFTKGELEWLKSEADDLLEKTQAAIEADGNPEAKKRLPKIKKFVADIEQSLSKQESGGKAPVTKPEGKSDVVVDKASNVGGDVIKEITNDTKYPYKVYKGDVGQIETTGEGVTFFTRDKQGAEYYTKSREEQGVSKGKTTFEGYISTKNPLIVDAKSPSPIPLVDKDGKTIAVFGEKGWEQKVKDEGYDAVIINRKFENDTPIDGWEIVSFDKSQIKNLPEQPPSKQESGGASNVGGDVEATAKKIVGESAFDKLKKEGYTIEKGKFDSDAYASFFGLHTGVQADEFANAGLRLVKPSEKIKVYRGKGKNVSEGENEGVTWVAEDKKVAENYSNDGNVEEIEVTKPKNPFPNPTDTIHVKGSDVGNKLKGILNRLFREGKVTKEQAIEASKAIDEFVLAAGEESELYSTKTNKKGVSSKYVKALQALGFDGIVQKESYNSGSPFTATKTGNETNTYGIFKAVEQSLKETTKEETTTQEGKVAELEAARDMEVLREGKPEVKLEFVSAKELVDSKDPIGNKKVHSDIKDRYKELRNLLDCLWT